MSVDISHDQDAQRQLLRDSKVIALVGYSPDTYAASNQIGAYLKDAGYTVYAVNPTVDEIDGEPSYPTLADVPEAVDIVNVFRRPEYLPGVVDEAIAIGAKAIWAQVGVTHPDALQKAEAGDTPIVMNACIRTAHRRLGR